MGCDFSTEEEKEEKQYQMQPLKHNNDPDGFEKINIQPRYVETEALFKNNQSEQHHYQQAQPNQFPKKQKHPLPHNPQVNQHFQNQQKPQFQPMHHQQPQFQPGFQQQPQIYNQQPIQQYGQMPQGMFASPQRFR